MGKRVNTKRRNTKHRNTNRKLKLLRGGAGTSAETSIKISQNKAYIIILLNIIKDLMIIPSIKTILSKKKYLYQGDFKTTEYEDIESVIQAAVDGY